MHLSEQGPRGFYFEEFEVGMKMTTRARTITEADLVNFAGVTGDYNSLHTDRVYAETSFMGQRVAHGMLGLSFVIGLAVQLGILEKTILGFRNLEMTFSAPITIGDTIHGELEVVEKKLMARIGGGLVTVSLRVRNQDGKTTQKGSLGLLMALTPQDETETQEG